MYSSRGGGVRPEPGGPLGTNYSWVPNELAHINHRQFPYAIGTGLILAGRFRLARNEGREVLRYTGKSVLRLAGIRTAGV